MKKEIKITIDITKAHAYDESYFKGLSLSLNQIRFEKTKDKDDNEIPAGIILKIEE